jgi:hypothetical protein
MKRSPTRLDYCQYLLVTPVNHTLTNFADHKENMSHDAINRLLLRDQLSPQLIWENVNKQVVMSMRGYLLFDDTIIDKSHAHKIELVRRQYSGNAHGIIKGIGVVTCVYVNPDTEQHWIVDYRIFDPDGDGKSKLDHVRDMLDHSLEHKKLLFGTVLMDSWYATREMMLYIESLKKIYYCPLKSNRLVNDSETQWGYRCVDTLEWDEAALKNGKLVKVRGFPAEHRLKLFRVEVSTHRTEWIVTNDLTQDSSQASRKVCSLRWKIEQFHREAKQLTGLEKCQCRKARIQRNHIACAILVWVRLAEIARAAAKSLYQVKHGLLDDFLCKQLKNPSIRMRLA